MLMKKNWSKLLLASLALSVSVNAANQGTIGETSEGDFDIEVEIPQLIVVRGLEDIDFGSYAGTGSLDEDFDLNVAVNYAAGTYSVTLTGDGPGFTLTDGTDTIAYTVEYNDATGTGGTAATSGVPLGGQDASVEELGDATDNANIRVQIAESALQAVSAGLYEGNVTVLVQPE